LLLPFRRVLLSPRRLIEHLELARAAPDARVLELGCGPGFFSAAVARALPRGRLELVDFQPEMLEKARRRLRRAGARNVSLTNADAAALPFAPASFDAAFAVAVLGEVHDVEGGLAGVARALNADGRLIVAELPGDPDRLTLDVVGAIVARHGLELERSAPLGSGFIATFRRR
jgi:ubiquinone/menaquinone biosynthesis C-methylase UbiE